MRAHELEVLQPNDRAAVAVHIAQLLHVANAQRGTFRLDDEPFSDAQRAEAVRYFSQPDVQTFVARDQLGNTLAGGSVRMVPERGAVISYVFCAPEAQGQGYGRSVLHTILSYIREQQVWPIYLYVNPANAPAVALYTHAGFCAVPRDPTDAMIEGWQQMAIEERAVLNEAIISLAPRDMNAQASA